MTLTPEHRAQAARLRLAKKQEALEATVLMDGGAKVYPDTTPGVGWVLLSPTGHKRYYQTRLKAAAAWATLWVYQEHQEILAKANKAQSSRGTQSTTLELELVLA